MRTMANRQYGLSLSGLLMVAAILGFAAIFGMKLIPAYMQDAEIKNIFDAVARDPEMQKAQVRDIRLAYSKRAVVANVTAIKPDDVEIGKDGDSISLSASYSIKVPLAGNASLLLEFNPSNSR
ncbi:MAG: DUF4845 domain-containing protein [Nitrosomonadales bacterium]|nr:DUF4845 domain-containing protein [Nitrosomonadales bacterium]